MTEEGKTYWLASTGDEVPSGREDDWLCDHERETLQELRVLKRRADWRLGRWTAKRAVCLYLKKARGETDLASVEIVAASDGAPEVLIDGDWAPFGISISHSGGVGFCVVSPGRAAVGCDVETVAPRSDRFVTDYFTASEREAVAQAEEGDRPSMATLIWSAKESALKALRTGLDRDTRSVEVDVGGADYKGDWQRLRVASRDPADTFFGWWREEGDKIFTLLSSKMTELPSPLRDF